LRGFPRDIDALWVEGTGIAREALERGVFPLALGEGEWLHVVQENGDSVSEGRVVSLTNGKRVVVMTSRSNEREYWTREQMQRQLQDGQGRRPRTEGIEAMRHPELELGFSQPVQTAKVGPRTLRASCNTPCSTYL
jgi:hypothetical protein